MTRKISLVFGGVTVAAMLMAYAAAQPVRAEVEPQNIHWTTSSQYKAIAQQKNYAKGNVNRRTETKSQQAAATVNDYADGRNIMSHLRTRRQER
jgi:hypothetical protein